MPARKKTPAAKTPRAGRSAAKKPAAKTTSSKKPAPGQRPKGALAAKPTTTAPAAGKGAPAPKKAAPVPYARPASGPVYWLVKSEPEVFSWDDLERSPGRTTHWDGVRNYLARNFMRDGMRVGDLVLFYHSNAEPPAAVGVCEVVREAYPDHTAFDAADPHFDAGSDPASPTWLMVDLRAVERFRTPVTLPMLRGEPALDGMELLRRGSRLSVQPVTPAHWDIVVRLGRAG